MMTPVTVNSPSKAAPTRAQREAIAERTRRAKMLLAERHPAYFASYVDRKMAKEYQARHLLFIGTKLKEAEAGALWQDVAGDGVKIVVIEAPPRHWKSSLINKFVAWFIGKRVNESQPHQVILTSYGAELAVTNSRAVLTTVRDTPEFGEVFPGVVIDPNRSAANNWALLGEPTTTCIATGVGGALTGQGADLMVIDDPVKDFSDAASPTSREAKWQWWLTTARTRVNPGGFVVIPLTRWHEDDLVGRMLANQEHGDRIVMIRLPALAESQAERQSAGLLGLPVDEDDPLGRKPGEALWPRRYSASQLQATKRLGPAAFEALYQGRPRREGGYLLGRHHFKMLHSKPGKDVRWCWIVDFAYTEKQVKTKSNDPDWTAMGLIGLWTPEGNRQDARLVIAEMHRWQASLTQIKANVKRLLLTTPGIGAASANDFVDRIAFDDLRADADLISRRLKTLPRMKGDKVVKSAAWRDRAEGGLVYLVEGAWNGWFLDQVEAFPRGTHDDGIDVVSVGTQFFGLGTGNRAVMSAKVTGFG